MAASKTIWLKRSYLGSMALFYITMLLIFGIMQLDKVPPMPILSMQLAAIFLTFFFSFLYSNKSVTVTCLIIFFFQLIAAFSLRYFFIEYFHNPLGYKPADALYYHEIASRFSRFPLHDFTMFMDSLDFMLDDRGMNYVSYFIYRIAGSPENGLKLAVLFNVCCITASSFFVFKLANCFVIVKHAQFAAFIWGTQLYSTYSAASGLKENFMVLFIIMSLYFIIRLYHEVNMKNVILALLCALVALLFRMALFYMLLASVLFMFAMKYPLLRRYIYILIALAIFFTWYFYQRTFDEMAVLRRGADAMDYDTYQGLVENKMNNAGAFASIVSYLSALIGPLPNLIASGGKVNYITLFSFSSFCKSFYAFYFIYGIYQAIKDKRVDLITLLVFWFLDVFMLIITYFTLHDRYHWPHLAIVIILSVWGGSQWHTHRHNRLIHSAYMAIVFVIITIFNFR